MVEPRRRFRFLKELSEGAFGKVYMAEMITGEGFSSIVAIKLLHGKWAGHQEIAQRSRDEARLLGLLHHRNIVRVEDLSSINGQCAIVMEYLDGVDIKALTAYCQKNGIRFPRRAAFEITAQIAGALEAAYNQMPLKGGQPLHVIHRDIKPSNVMLTPAGDVKVLDFGTARANFEEREAKTQALAFGSQAYMAPERLLGDPDGPAGDVFSLGVTLFEMLTFQSYGKIFIRQERYDRALDERMEMVDLSDLNGENADLVRDVMRRLLAYDGAVRPSSGEVVDLMDNLADAINDGSMQRFCRQVVKPCKDAMEAPQNPDDPLTGSTLFEDTNTGLSLLPHDIPPEEAAAQAPAEAEPSSPTFAPEAPPAPAVDAAPPPQPEPPATPSWSAPQGTAQRTFDSAVARRPAGASLTPDLQRATPTQAPPVATSVPTAAPTAAPTQEPQGPLPTLPPPPPPPRTLTVQPMPGPTAAPPQPAPQPSGGNARRIILLSAIVGILVVVAVATLLFNGGDKGAAETPTPTPSTTPGPGPTTPAAAKAAPGGRLEIGPMDGSNGALRLTLSKPGPVNITSALSGFKHDWDGTGTLEIIGVPPGSYRTRVGSGSDTARSAISVEAGKTCTYAWPGPTPEDWEAKGCQ